MYIAGTEPVGTCPLHGGRNGVTNVAGWDTGSGNPVASADTPANGGSPAAPAPAAVARRAARQASAAAAQPPPGPAKGQDTRKPEEKKSILRRLLGVFK